MDNGGDGGDATPDDGDGDGDDDDDEADEDEDDEPSQKANTIEDLIVGRIVFPDTGKCLQQNLSVTDEMTKCWRVTIGYYKYPDSVAIPP